MSDYEDIKPNAMVDQVDFNFGTDFQKQKILNNKYNNKNQFNNIKKVLQSQINPIILNMTIRIT